MHWADQIAKEVVAKRPGKQAYLVESGVTPSGVVHAGNFRETMTQDLVANALARLGANARYQYVWDDFDRFRKVPVGVPAEWEQYIGMPVSDVPDPWGDHSTWATHFTTTAEEEMRACGIVPRFVYSSQKYRACEYANEMQLCLKNTEKIKAVLGKFRDKELTPDWLPVQVYCEACNKDETRVEWNGEWTLKYSCSRADCGRSGEFDFSRKGLAKLRWRIDWPMRWKHYGVDFESAGKDHHAAGGSWDTAEAISREVFAYDPPVTTMYEFISVKGAQGKMSSSKGNVVTVTDLLEIYEPEIVRFIYTGKVNKALELPFDLDVYNKYNYYDQSERVYWEKEACDNEREKQNHVRQYELSQVRPRSAWKWRAQPEFSFCAAVTQVCKDYDDGVQILKRAGHLPKDANAADVERAKLRLRLAENWIAKHAPDSVKLAVLESVPPEARALSEQQKKALAAIADAIDDKTVEEMNSVIKDAASAAGIEAKQLFEAAYTALLGRKTGPRLSSLLLSLDSGFVKKRLRLAA
jgi:lysyl-tRNA synthetase class 1